MQSFTLATKSIFQMSLHGGEWQEVLAMNGILEIKAGAAKSAA